MRRVVVGILSLGLWAVGAEAAQVNRLEGQVAINRGQGYTTVANSTQGNDGNRVLAKQNSRAEIIYENGCRVIVDPGMVVRISYPPPCQPLPQAAGTPAVTAGQVLAGAIVTGVIVTYAASSSNAASP